MEAYSIVIILLAVAIGLSPVASKIKIPYPILLLIAGIGVGFIPGFQQVSINPDVVFLIFLPPMLYDAAFNISFRDFRNNMNTISLLAISLVFITATGIAVVARYCIPGMTWPLAFVLGAILSPPDAIAAAGVTKGLHLPHRTNTILEGESLVNDASALVAFRFAVATVAGSSFVLWKAGVMFLVAMGGGFLMGWIIWLIFAFINLKFRLNSSVIVSLNVMLPFVAYLLAEEFHVSGVIAVVTAGLIISRHKRKFSEEVRIQSKSVWDTVTFILGGLIFILIGLTFPRVLEDIPFKELGSLIGASFLIFLIALIIRIIVIFWHEFDSKKKLKMFQERLATMPEWKKNEKVRRHYEERLRRIKNFKPLSIKDCIIIGWSGMRGIVSLAAALSLPLVMDDGSVFPLRDTIIFLTVVVVIIMLIIQGIGLPLLIKLLKMKEYSKLS